MERRGTRWALAGWAALVVLFLWVPLALIMVYAFNKSNVQSWPIPGFTTHWFRTAWHAQEVRDAVWLSVRAALFATSAALVLGSAAAFARMIWPLASSSRVPSVISARIVDIFSFS